MCRTICCPLCETEINYLKEWTKVWVEYIFAIDEQGTPWWDSTNTQESTDITEYLCPECGKVLFTHQEHAEAFLKGERND